MVGAGGFSEDRDQLMLELTKNTVHPCDDTSSLTVNTNFYSFKPVSGFNIGCVLAFKKHVFWTMESF